MRNKKHMFINGEWVETQAGQSAPVINPSTGEEFARISLGDANDVDAAAKAARNAFPAFSVQSRQARIELLQRIVEGFAERGEELAEAISTEMGAPITFARSAQVGSGPNHLNEMIRVLGEYEFEERWDSTRIIKEPIGVCGLITPWNWPINQIVCKVAPALAAGCTMVLKPSELAPFSAIIFAEILEKAGVPAGVFNLVHGTGPGVGQAIAAHPGIDMVSFTGSTRAGVQVAQAAAGTVKRVAQELGGKAPNILLPDADLERSVQLGVARCFGNAGQSCSAATRMLVPADLQDSVVRYAKESAESYRVGLPHDEQTTMGPVISQAQYDKVQELIASGIEEGATLVTGGLGRPDGLEQGYFVRPTVFSDVKPSMRIAREEIFGAVLSIMPYETVDEAVNIANDTEYGLSAYVQSQNLDLARSISRKLRAGNVHINYPPMDRRAPFGGYKQSGNGREWGRYGLEEFLETKAVIGYGE